MTAYVAILRQSKKGDYRVTFPDLPGCVAAGSTLEEARRKAAETLSLHLGGMVDAGSTAPTPTPQDQITADRENEDGLPFLVKVREPDSRTVRVNITLSASVLEDVDAHAEKTGTNRSGFLAHAALSQIYARIALREDDVRNLENQVRHNEPRRQEILTLLKRWRHEPGLTKDVGVDSLIDEILQNPSRTATNALPHYLASLTPVSRRGTKDALNVLASILGYSSALEVPWHKLTYAQTSALQARLIADGRKPDYARKIMYTLSSVLRWSAKLELMTWDDFKKATALEPIRGSRLRNVKELGEGDLEAMLSATRRDPKPLRGSRDRALLALFAGGGLTRSEVARLKVTDFNREEPSVRVMGGRGKERPVPLPQWAAHSISEFLDARRAKGGDPILCPVSQRGEAKKEALSGGQAAYIVLRRIARRAGVKLVPTFAFRRAYCRQLVDSGVNVFTTQNLLGHASPAATHMLYDRGTSGALTEAASRIPNPERSA